VSGAPAEGESALERYLIRAGSFRSSLIELDLLNMAGAELREGRDGYGSITFGNVGTMTQMPASLLAIRAHRSAPEFMSINDVKRVFDTLQRARADLRASLLRSGATVG
jgi:hypothetical protein